MVGILNLARQRNAPRFGALKLAGGAQLPVRELPQLPVPGSRPAPDFLPLSEPSGGSQGLAGGPPGPGMPPTEAPDQGQIKGLLSRFLSAPGQGQALGLLGSYLMAAGAPTTDPGARTRVLAEGLREYAQTLRASQPQPEKSIERIRAEAEAGRAPEKSIERIRLEAEAKRAPPGEATGFTLGRGQTRFGPGGKEIAAVPAAPIARYSGEVRLDENVGKFYQVNPKTGKREYISPNEEFLIESTPGGGFRFRRGPDTGGGGLTTSVRTKIQTKQFDTQESLVRLREMADQYRPEFQEIPTRLGAAWTGLKARFGAGDVPPEERQLLTDFAEYRRNAFEAFNAYIKNIAGTQVSAAEEKRTNNALPNPGTGIFSGDDPITFEAKMNSAIEMAEKASIRYHHYLQQGITDPEEMALRAPLDSIELYINETTGKQGAIINDKWVEY